MNSLNALTLDNSFWQFSLAQWKNDALQQHLLTLQDQQHHKINSLLLCMWLAFEGKDIKPYYHEIMSASSEWHSQIVAPIRNARQALATQTSLPTKTLKTQLQTAELQAEQIEQALLYQASLTIPDGTHANYDTLDWLINNLSASDLAKSDLSLLIQNSLSTYPVARIHQRLHTLK